MAEKSTNTAIVGASAAGLAVGRCLQDSGVPFILLEKNEHVAGAWRNHYERLHLHTSKRLSALPDRPFPEYVAKYPSREQVVAYLESYAREFGLDPQFGQEVTSVRRDQEGWQVFTRDDHYRASNVVIATGYARRPHEPALEGMAAYEGEILHSSRYQSGERFVGQRVLVVGCGNSGAEIALDLWEHGAQPTISVRGPVHVVPRDLLGLPILAWSIFLSKLPTRLADLISAPLVRASTGDLSRYGLRKPPYGPMAQILQRGQIPLIDVGTVQAIKEGKIGVRPGIARFTVNGVVFADGATGDREQQLDAVVLATGYRPALADFLEAAGEVTDASGVPRISGRESSLPGLYFCGFYVSPAGMLHEIASEARRIARDIRIKRSS